MNTRVVLSVLASSMLLLSSGAGAAGLGFLKNSPLYYFNQADMKLMNEAARAVLDAPEANGQREWKNPKTGHSGKVESLGNFRSADGETCRKLKLWNQAKGIESESVFPVCKTGNGDWQLASGKELTKA
jgi:hypothetical protein